MATLSQCSGWFSFHSPRSPAYSTTSGNLQAGSPLGLKYSAGMRTRQRRVCNDLTSERDIESDLPKWWMVLLSPFAGLHHGLGEHCLR